MKLAFVKMHGAGNDFVMVDNRAGSFAPDAARVRRLANRPDGVGCEGVILVEPSKTADFSMRFFNPDGSEAELCGNGARCVAAFAWAIGAVKAPAMRFETLAGPIAAEVLTNGLVKVVMPPPKDLRENFVNSGVPHLIVPVPDVEAVDVDARGRELRFSETFAPAGTNVDFVEFVSPRALRIRTYERGVEAETFACGTGSVAAAVVGVARHGLAFPVDVATRSGAVLTIDGVFDGASFANVTLTGPVKRVFAGEIDLD